MGGGHNGTPTDTLDKGSTLCSQLAISPPAATLVPSDQKVWQAGQVYRTGLTGPITAIRGRDRIACKAAVTVVQRSLDLHTVVSLQQHQSNPDFFSCNN